MEENLNIMVITLIYNLNVLLKKQPVLEKWKTAICHADVINHNANYSNYISQSSIYFICEVEHN